MRNKRVYLVEEEHGCYEKSRQLGGCFRRSSFLAAENHEGRSCGGKLQPREEKQDGGGAFFVAARVHEENLNERKGLPSASWDLSPILMQQ